MPPAELCVVGDADQSIYAFRGATIRNIVEFEQDYPDARTILLEQNYRSTQTILRAANAVIATQHRAPRRRSCGPTPATGAQIVGYVADNEHDEAAFVAREIDELADDHGVTPGDVAVFYRTNAQSRALEEVFIRVGLPYKVVGGTRFYERREVKDALAYLRVARQPRRHGHPAAHPQRAQARHRRPRRGVRRGARRARADLVRRRRWAAPRTRRASRPARSTAIQGFTDAARGRCAPCHEGGAGVAGLLEAVLEQTGYLAELRASHDPQDETRVENLAELRRRRHGSSTTDAADEHRRGDSARATSSSGSRSSPTPTRSPTPTEAEPRPASSR